MKFNTGNGLSKNKKVWSTEEYVHLILRECAPKCKKNKHGELIRVFNSNVDAPEGGKEITLFISSTENFILQGRNREKVHLISMSHAALWEVVEYLEASWQTEPSKDMMVELPDFGDGNWRVEPMDIIVQDEDKKELTLGKLGVAVESVENAKSMLSAIFISADKSWTRLTVWVEGDKETTDLATSDLNCIASALITLSNTIKLNSNTQDEKIG